MFITSVCGHTDFDSTALQQLADNPRNPGERVPDPNQRQVPEQQSLHPSSSWRPNPKRRVLLHVI